MKTNYWNPHRSSSIALLAIAIVAVAGVGAVEYFQVDSARPYLQAKLTAAESAQRGMAVVKAVRLERGLEIDPITDISQSGLIGESHSSITSNNGYLPAKQTTVNPNFAAVIVDMLAETGVEEGDTVAVGFSGSFPAINLCVLAAAEAMNVKPIIISSTTASQWGANSPELLWIDMEDELVRRDVFHHRSQAASLGGVEDLAIGVSKEGKQTLRDAITRHELPMIKPKDYLDSVNQRMDIYRRHAGGAPIKAYINVGGGTVSVGTKQGKKLFNPGVNHHKPLGPLPADSVMARFIGQGTPVIHLSHIDDLALRYGLPRQPTTIPAVGEGDVYTPRSYNKWLAGGLLAAIVVSLMFLTRMHQTMPVDEQQLKTTSRKSRRSTTREAEPMPL